MTVASIILKRKMFGTTKMLPKAGHPVKLNNQGRRALVREVTNNPMLTEMGEPSKRTTIFAALKKSGLYGRVARLKPHDSQKAPKNSDHEKQNSLV
jgi:hypothetical protein